MRMIIPVNTDQNRPHFLANNSLPYTCGQCGHECTSVQDQAMHMHSEHAEFMAQVTEHTGIGQGAEIVMQKFGNHEDVIHEDPVSLLHKMQRHIAATHIACDFQSSARFVNPEYAEFFRQNVAYLEKLAIEYPGATEIYENIARGAQLLGRERMAADYWALAIESDVAFDRRILSTRHRLAINSTMARIGDEENSYLACTHPYRFSISGLFTKSLFKKSYPEVAAWPTKRSIKPMIKALRDDPLCKVKQGFRSVLVEFRDIKSCNDATFSALMDGSIEAGDLDQGEIDRLDGRLPVLMECLNNCDYFVGAERDYWLAHLQLYIAHRMARRSQIEEGLSAADDAISLMTKFESRKDYPDYLPHDLIEEYAEGVPSTSVHAHLTRAGLFSQVERHGEADLAYNASIERARSSSHFDYLEVVALTKAGEHAMLRDNERAKDFISAAILLDEERVGSLEDAIEHGDLRLLKLKDTLLMIHEMGGEANEAELLRKEVDPFQEFITWRYTGNIYDSTGTE